MFNKEMSLQELVIYKQKLEKELPEGELVPDDVTEMVEVANMLLAGRVDQAARFRAGLMAHIEAGKAQLANMNEMLEMTEILMKKAVDATEAKRLDGAFYSLRVQKNGGAPATIIDDELKLPMKFKKVVMTNSFPYSDDNMLYWARATLGRLVEWKKDLVEKEKDTSPFYRLDIADNEREKLQKHLVIEPSKSAISEELKKPGGLVDGAHQERGSHLRVEAGKAKAKEISHV